MAELTSWRSLDRSMVFERAPWLRLVADRVQLPDGQILSDWIHVELPDYVVIVPVTADLDVLTIRSYKHGVGRVRLALPAGYLEADEEPREAAGRELLEETGYAATDWSHLGSFTVDGNRGCGIAHLFLAQGAEPVAAADSGDLEEIVVELVALKDLQAAVSSGEIAELSMAAAICLATSALAGP